MCVSPCSWADQHLQPIVITSYSSEDSHRIGQVEETLHSGFFSRMEREDFNGSAQTVAELLEQQAGVQIRRSGGMGSFASASLRASSPEQVMIYVDGIPLNGGANAVVNLGDIALADVAAIEIYRGTTPVQFAQGSMGGVINIRRLDSDKETSSIRLGVGSFDNYQTSAHTQGRLADTAYLLSLGHSESENDYPFTFHNKTPFDSSDDRKEKRHNAWFEQQTLLLKLEQHWSERLRLNLSQHLAQKQQGLPTWSNNPQASAELQREEYHSRLGFEATELGDSQAQWATHLDLRSSEETLDDRADEIGLLPQHQSSELTQTSLNSHLEWPLELHQLSAALTLGEETYRPQDLLNHDKLAASTRHSLHLAVQDIWLAHRRLSLAPALRYQNLHDELGKTDSLVVIEDTHRDYRVDALTSQLGAQLMLSARLELKANWGEYLRPPGFFELFGDQGLFLGNPQLEAESGINRDVGVIWTPASDESISQRFELVYFDNRIHDIIVRTYDARGIGKAQNLGHARVYGVEGSYTLSRTKDYALNATVNWQDPRNLSRQTPNSYNKRLPGRYVLQSRLRLEKTLGEARVHLQYSFEEGSYYDSANLLPVGMQEQSDLGLRWENEGLHLGLEVNNLFDQQSSDFYRHYPQPGRHYFFSLQYET